MSRAARPSPLLGLLALALSIAACTSSPVSPAGEGPDRPAGIPRTTTIEGSFELLDQVGGGSTDPTGLTVLTATDEADIEPDGTFEVVVPQTDEHQLLIIRDKSDKTRALSYGRAARGQGLGITSQTTAISLVMLNPMFLYASGEQRDSLMTEVRHHQDFGELRSRVREATVGDPDDPLDPERHPVMYEIAANIARDIIEGESGGVAFRGRNEPVILDGAGKTVIFENDMCVNFGAGIELMGGGASEGVGIGSKDTAIKLRFGWPPWVEVSPEETKHDLEYGRYVVEINKGFDPGWYAFDLSTANGVGSLWNLAKGIELTMSLLAGVSSLADSPASLTLQISAASAEAFDIALRDGNAWDICVTVLSILLDNHERIAYWYWQNSTSDAGRDFVRKANEACRRIATPTAIVQLGWEFGNKALPFFYDLTVANQERTYFVDHDSSGTVVSENFPPERPATPMGPARVWTGRSYEYWSTTTDRDGEDISCRFWWGPDENSGWSAYVAGGTPVGTAVAFPAPGNHQVTVEAQDTNGIVSDMSDALDVFVRNLPVVVDVQPRWFPNLVADRPGVLRAHVVGTDTLDVRRIDTASVRLQVVLPWRTPAPAAIDADGLAPTRWRIADVNAPDAVDVETHDHRLVKDGIDDLELTFDRRQVGAMLAGFGEVERALTVRGRLLDGTVFEGFAEVVTVRGDVQRSAMR